ncbi:MAG: SpoIIE family protein phosphatase [Bacteroidota bacterium]
MNRPFRAYCACLFCFFILNAHTQDGVPFITYYDSREGFESQNWSICQDDHNAMLFANKNGISRFDGLNWSSVSLPHVPLKIGTHPHMGEVYMISNHNYGRVQRDVQGNLIYETLYDEDEQDLSPNNILFTDNSVIFYGDNHISFHSLKDHALELRLKAEQFGSFAGMVLTPSEVLVNIKGKGLHLLVNESLVPLEKLKATSESRILFDLPYSDSEVIIGLDNGDLKIFDGSSLKDYTLSYADYLSVYGLSDGIVLTDSTYAFSSLYGGVLIVNRNDGKVITLLNYENGLPDDEIYSIGKDKNGGLWVTYKYGISRVDFTLPIKEYSFYSGLEGLLSNAIWYENSLYVTTSEGLYYLSEVKHYQEEEIILLKQPESNNEEASVDQQLSGENKKKGFLSRITRRWRDRKQPEELEEPEELEGLEEPVRESRYVRKKVSKLASIEYVYKKVRGLNTRCELLMSTESALLVGSTSGLYGVNDSMAVRLSDSRNIRYIHRYDSSSYYVISDDGLEVMHMRDNSWLREKPENLIMEPLFSVTHDPDYIWVSGYSDVYRINPDLQDNSGLKKYSFYSVFPEELQVSYINDTLFKFSNTGVEYYEQAVDSFKMYISSKLNPDDYSSLEVFPITFGFQWLKANNRMLTINRDSKEVRNIENLTGLFSNVTSLSHDANKGYWVVDDYTRIFNIESSNMEGFNQEFMVHIDRVLNSSGEPVDMQNLIFFPDQRMIEIQMSAPFFPGGNSTDFQYIIDGKMENWSKFSNKPGISLFLEPGNHTVRVRARNFLGNISVPNILNLTIKAPFYLKSWFYVSLIPVLLLLFYIIIYLRERKIKQDKEILEAKVEERTIQIVNQKRQIESQKNAITDSINYAGRIQKAILPSINLFEKSFAEYFIFFKPKYIVSGDFYWITETENQVIFSVVDCTGHGVPGAFMSMLGNSILNEITRTSREDLTADGILNQLNTMTKQALSQSGSSSTTFDGMDIALCVYNKNEGELEYAGAHNPLYLIRNGELQIQNADNMPIGYFSEEGGFTNHRIKIEKEDIIYLFSDGYIDQFGGAMDKKFTPKRFRELLLSISHKPLKEQEKHLDIQLAAWKGDEIQIDDILVLAVKF